MATTKRKATPRTKQLSSIPTQYLACRSLGHNWRYFDVDETHVDTERVLTQELHCNVCDSYKFQDVDAETGYIERTRYRYSEGYLVHGLGRLTADDNGFIRLRAVGVAK